LSVGFQTIPAQKYFLSTLFFQTWIGNAEKQITVNQVPGRDQKAFESLMQRYQIGPIILT